MRPLAATALALLLLPATAGAQSSDSSVNCSNGVCTRVESWRPDDGRGRGWTTIERWREDRPRHAQRHWAPPYWTPPGWHDDRPHRRPRRDRDEDDD